MAKYALIADGVNSGYVIEFIDFDGPVEGNFPTWYTMVDVDNKPSVQVGWIAEWIDNEWKFRPWAPSQQDIINNNTIDKNYKMSVAYKPMAQALLDAKLCYYDESGTTPLAKQWQQYWIDLGAVDLTQTDPVWPTTPSPV